MINKEMTYYQLLVAFESSVHLLPGTESRAAEIFYKQKGLVSYYFEQVIGPKYHTKEARENRKGTWEEINRTTSNFLKVCWEKEFRPFIKITEVMKIFQYIKLTLKQSICLEDLGFPLKEMSPLLSTPTDYRSLSSSLSDNLTGSAGSDKLDYLSQSSPYLDKMKFFEEKKDVQEDKPSGFGKKFDKNMTELRELLK